MFALYKYGCIQQYTEIYSIQVYSSIHTAVYIQQYTYSSIHTAVYIQQYTYSSIHTAVYIQQYTYSSIHTAALYSKYSRNSAINSTTFTYIRGDFSLFVALWRTLRRTKLSVPEVSVQCRRERV